MRRVVFVTGADAQSGFSLAGFPQYTAGVPDAGTTVRRAMGEADVGLLVIDERLMKGLTEALVRELEQTWDGVSVILPSPGRPPEDTEDYALRLIRRAIGYHVRLRV